jgi:hypothetical protein
MNIIFLDIDGVLNNEIGMLNKTPEQYHKEQDEIGYPLCMVDPRCISLLNDLIEETESKIVMSSTWRKGKSIKEIQELCDLWGIKGEVVGKTPSLLKYGTVRGNEINSWIEDNEKRVTNYIILDDDSDMLLCQRNHFFHCDGFSGLTPNIIYKAKRFLKEEE